MDLSIPLSTFQVYPDDTEIEERDVEPLFQS